MSDSAALQKVERCDLAPRAALAGSRWAVSLLRLSAEKAAPLSNTELASHSSSTSTFFQGAPSIGPSPSFGSLA
eukprot:scaffold6412_cov153-Isochrysis_galbana.AAC.1